MSKPVYADYINHMLRFYCRTINSHNIRFKDEIDKENFKAVKKVLHGLPEEDRSVIIDVYSKNDTLSDNIYTVSKERKINQDKIWIIVSKVTNLIAKERMLI